ncbi:MAG: HNH endonuclease [Hyphomicrobium sp.]
MSIETDFPGVTKQNRDQLGAAAAYYNENYDIAFKQVLETGGHQQRLGIKPCPCRFCGRSIPAVTFGKIAHAIPEFVGNGTLVAHYECDECNERFSAFEDDLAKMTLLHRVAGQIIGKSGVPSAKTPQKLSRIDMGASGLEIKHFIDDPIVTIDDIAHTLKIRMTSQPYRPLGAFKALAKMAVSVMDDDDVARVPETLLWLRSNDLTTDQIDDGTNYSCLRTFTPGPAPYPRSVVILLRRKSAVVLGPQFIFAVAFGNLSFQIIVPAPQLDHQLAGQTLTLHPVPLFPFMLAENVKGATAAWCESFTSPDKTKAPHEISFKFDSMSEVVAAKGAQS